VLSLQQLQQQQQQAQQLKATELNFLLRVKRFASKWVSVFRDFTAQPTGILTSDTNAAQ